MRSGPSTTFPFIADLGAIDLRCCVGDMDDDFIQFTAQRFADQVQVFQIDTLGKFMVQLIDGGRPYSRYAREFGLRSA